MVPTPVPARRRTARCAFQRTGHPGAVAAPRAAQAPRMSLGSTTLRRDISGTALARRAEPFGHAAQATSPWSRRQDHRRSPPPLDPRCVSPCLLAIGSKRTPRRPASAEPLERDYVNHRRRTSHRPCLMTGRIVQVSNCRRASMAASARSRPPSRPTAFLAATRSSTEIFDRVLSFVPLFAAAAAAT